MRNIHFVLIRNYFDMWSNLLFQPSRYFSRGFSIPIYTFLLLLAARCLSSSMGRESAPIKRESYESKSFFQGLFRRFAFPPGTFLIFTPEITIPAWRNYQLTKRNGKKIDDSGLCEGGNSINSKFGYLDDVEDTAAIKNSAIDISSPFFVYFDKLGWTHVDSIYNTPPHVASFIQEYLVDPVIQIFGVPPPISTKKNWERNTFPKDAHKKVTSRTTIPLFESHRLSVFQRIESLLEDLGAGNGRVCLLRAICEIHEFPLDKQKYGLFGEVLVLILGALPAEGNKGNGKYDSISSPCMSVYATAEKHGRNGNCMKYTEHCPFSIFQWAWNPIFPQKFLTKLK